MKPIGLVAALLATVALVAAVGLAVSREIPASESGVAASPLADDTPSRDEVRALEARVDQLSRQLDSLQLELSFLRSQTVAPINAVETPLAAGSRDPATAQPTALWYLDRYERSFDGGGAGSEYFRLAVAAFAHELVEPIEARVRDGARLLPFRQRLIAILGDASFEGDGRVLALLGWVIGGSDERALAQEALSALARVGDASAAPMLERDVWRIAWPELQQRALEIIVAVSGAEANAALLRLMHSAPSDAQLIQLIPLLQASELVAALEAFRIASRESQPVRLAAALRVSDFRGADFSAFVDGWAADERDPEVLAALGRAQDAQLSTSQWSAAHAVGPPDADARRDDPHAWASRSGDMGEQWLELTYSPPRRAAGVRVFEVNSAGAVTAVIGIDGQGGRRTLWSGVDPTKTPGVLELTFPLTTFAVARLRIVLDTDRTPGWNEIDAVELCGPDGSAWASEAIASSEYGH